MKLLKVKYFLKKDKIYETWFPKLWLKTEDIFPQIYAKVGGNGRKYVSLGTIYTKDVAVKRIKLQIQKLQKKYHRRYRRMFEKGIIPCKERK